MTCQEHLVRYFRENRVKYTILPQHPRAFAALQSARYEHVPPGSVAKVVIVWIGERIAMLVLPASKQVNFHKLQAYWVTEKVRLAREVDFADIFHDCDLGAMPPFGNPYDLEVYMEESFIKKEKEIIFFSAGTYTDAMGIKCSDFMRLTGAKVIDFAYD